MIAGIIWLAILTPGASDGIAPRLPLSRRAYLRFVVTCASPGAALADNPPPAQVLSNFDFSALGHGLALIEQTSIAGGFTVCQASRPSGAWQEETSGTVPCTIEGDSFCRAITGHPELSTRSHLLVSFFNPGAAPRYNPSAGPEGHVMVAAFPW
jgi:hypothetical protein